MLFIGSCAARFYALDNATGEEHWSYDIKQDGDQNSFHGSMLVADELVLIGTDAQIGHIYAFEQQTGKVRWKYRVPGAGATTNILRDNSKIFTVVDGDELLCLDLATGELVWSFKDSLYQDSHPLFTQSAALENGRVFFGTNSGTVFALDAETGKVIWKTAVSGRVSTSVHAGKGAIYFGTGDSFLFRLSQQTGEVLASFFTEVTPVGRLTIDENGLYVFLNSRGGHGRGEQLLALDLMFEKELWRLKPATFWSASKSHIVNDLLLTGSKNGRIIAYQLTDGKQSWQLKLNGQIRSLNSEGNVLYIGTIEGVVYAVKLLKRANGR